MSIRVNDHDFELLSQFADGELNDMDARRLEQRLQTDSGLRATLTAIKALDTSLQDVLQARDAVPVSISDRVAQAVDSDMQTGDNVVHFPAASGRAAAVRTSHWPLAAAASLVAALGVALVMQQPEPLAPGLPGNDPLVSASLDASSSGAGWVALEDGRELQPVLTFAHRDGTWCREYLLRSEGSDWRAVACREGQRWVTQAAGLESYLDSASGYRPAGASDSAPVSVFISENAADVALGAEEELKLITEGW